MPEHAFSSSNRRYSLGVKKINFPRRVWVALPMYCLASFQGCLDSVVYPGLPSTENRAAKAHDSTLSNLTLTGGGTLYPAFSKSVLVYQDTVDDSVNTVAATTKTLDTTNAIIYDTDQRRNSIVGNMVRPPKAGGSFKSGL